MKMRDINILAEKILYSAETDGEELCKSILENYDFFDDVCGILREENARALIQQSTMREKTEALLSQILYFSDEHTISDTVFKMLCDYPKRKARNSF